MADQWRLSADTNLGTNGDVTTNWERNDSSEYGGIGTGLTESSGIFSFPTTGIYLINFTGIFGLGSADAIGVLELMSTLNNSNFSQKARSNAGTDDGGQEYTGSNNFIFDVTNITTHKFKFRTTSFNPNTQLRGNSSYQQTGFSVIRLGDT